VGDGYEGGGLDAVGAIYFVGAEHSRAAVALLDVPIPDGWVMRAARAICVSPNDIDGTQPSRKIG
jgi:hypothetical protein